MRSRRRCPPARAPRRTPRCRRSTSPCRRLLPARLSSPRPLVRLLRSERLRRGVLAGDPGGDLDPARVQVLPDLLLVLAPEAEAVRPHDVGLVVDLAGHPGLVLVLVPAPHLPLALV